ncbi:MAG: hypothetical protein GPJ54_04045 [Candidatus Heimdallarchaeota archaeon]|nr:hypothetical protein [Candidatus Heimdallarchaeota archaeon]
MHEGTVVPDLVLKLQLVAAGGLMMAELPKPEDDARSQLSGGIMTAIMAFSKEVHDREIEALAYADRSIIFIPMGDLTIVAEVSSSVSKENLNILIQEFKIRSELYFLGLDSDTIGVSEAEGILNQIYHSDWLEETITGLGYERPFANEDCIVVKFDHTNYTYDLIAGVDKPDIIKKAIDMVHFHDIDGPHSEDYCSGFVMFSVNRQAAFVVHFKEDNESSLGLLIVPQERAAKLFRLSPLMQLETKEYYENSSKRNINDLMRNLSLVRDHDAEYVEKIRSLEGNKLSFLENYIKDVEKILPQIILGDRLLIVGKEEIVDEVIMGLHHFGEHIQIPHIRWLTGGDDIGPGVTGLSPEKLSELKGMNKIPEGTICVDVSNKNFEGKKLKSNKFLKDLYKRSKNLPRAQASEIIKNQLYIVVSFAMTGSSYAFKPKIELLTALQDMKVSIKDNGQYELIQELLGVVNPWIKAVVDEIVLDDVWI